MQLALIGAGSWGTGLTLLLSEKGYNVRVWSNEPAVVEDINTNHCNSRYLPDVIFSDNVEATNSLGEAVSGAEAIVMVVPSEYVRDVASKLSKVIDKPILLVNAAKGLESSSGMRLSQIIAQEIPQIAGHIVALSGPNLAVEVARRVPTATVLASENEEMAKRAQEMINSRCLRAYRSTDVAGVELGGALKNVLAIGAGISDGLGYGDNTKAALITRGLAEMMRLAEACGAQPKTVMGLAGIGDLMATCSSGLSRNLRVGRALGSGMTPEEAQASVKQVAEGVPTCRAAYNLAASLGVSAPITEQIYKVLFEGKSPKEAVNDLMTRELKTE